jgi:hypothetical protein
MRLRRENGGMPPFPWSHCDGILRMLQNKFRNCFAENGRVWWAGAKRTGWRFDVVGMGIPVGATESS